MKSHSPHPTPHHLADSQQLQKELAQLQFELTKSGEREKKALADYQNLVRRTNADRQALAKFANRELIMDLLEPLEHLSLTAQQLKSPVLDSVISALWAKLRGHGLTQIDCLGQAFDPATMEAVEIGTNQEKKNQVTKVVKPGYLLAGEVIQPAKVVVD